MGRESKFNPETRKLVLDGIAAGMSQKGAAERAGIGERTLSRWLTLGRRKMGDPDFVAFLADLKKAERNIESAAVRGILEIGHGGIVVERVTRQDRQGNPVTTERLSQPQWTALAWWLERKFPEEWGKDSEILRDLVADLKKRQKAAAYG